MGAGGSVAEEAAFAERYRKTLQIVEPIFQGDRAVRGWGLQTFQPS